MCTLKGNLPAKTHQLSRKERWFYDHRALCPTLFFHFVTWVLGFLTNNGSHMQPKAELEYGSETSPSFLAPNHISDLGETESLSCQRLWVVMLTAQSLEILFTGSSFFSCRSSPEKMSEEHRFFSETKSSVSTYHVSKNKLQL